MKANATSGKTLWHRRLELSSAQRSILELRDRPDLLAGQWVSFAHAGQDVLDVGLVEERQFAELRATSEVKSDAGVSVRVASLAAIATMKKATGRAIDLADVRLIEEAKGQGNAP